MQFKGEFKQQYGKFTDAALQQIKGIDDTIIGKVQERYGDKKDEFMKWAHAPTGPQGGLETPLRHSCERPVEPKSMNESRVQNTVCSG
ncbi:MAG: CsbD family protein [Nitrospirales bacterium]|nr:CsbD family protein [Nitrospirales bacterium]